jgi:hypothetical protein
MPLNKGMYIANITIKGVLVRQVISLDFEWIDSL